ncbi:MAG: hypothetical protein ACI9VN_001549, partial [Patescibacteria group bacterium]
EMSISPFPHQLDEYQRWQYEERRDYILVAGSILFSNYLGHKEMRCRAEEITNGGFDS